MLKDRHIFIKNIYYMLSYAFQTLKQGNYEDVKGEAFTELHNLFAAILARGIGRLLKQGLYREYVLFQEALPVVRGKLDMVETMRCRMAQRRLVGCEYDELSENNLLNRILKSTCMLLLRHAKVEGRYKDALKRELLFFSQVEELDLKRVRWGDIRFQRNNMTYRMLVSLCQLLVEGMLITTESGEYRLLQFMDEQRMCYLYEKFILEYYATHYPQLHAKAAQIPWAVADGDVTTMLPSMNSDIHLQLGERVLIIDAKYYSRTLQGNYEKKSVHSHNLYQIFAYVKNRHYEFGAEPHEVAGMLLYAKTDEELHPDCSFHLHGSQIDVKTLDLNEEFALLAAQLDGIARDFFGPGLVKRE